MPKGNSMNTDITKHIRNPTMQIDIYLLDDDIVQVVPKDHNGERLAERSVPLEELHLLLAVTGKCLSEPEFLRSSMSTH